LNENIGLQLKTFNNIKSHSRSILKRCLFPEPYCCTL